MSEDLELFINNDAELYEKYRKPIYAKLAEAKLAGKYSHTAAVKEFLALAAVGAKKYQREVQAKYFTSDEKKEYAESAAEYFEVEWKLGNMHGYASGAEKWNPASIPMLGTAGNPCAHQNPFEVRSTSGLEGVFAERDDAEFYADEIRGAGASGVTVERQERATRPRIPRYSVRNPSSRLFAGIYPTGIVYADKSREVDGDYMRVAFLPFSTLELEWEAVQTDAAMREEIQQDAGRVIARRGEQYPVSASGQTVTLGNPPRVTREKYGDSSEIVIEHNRYGYTGWLESKRGGGRLPISFGARQPDTAAEAMQLAKRFLAGVHGKNNPSGLTAKGERMYEHIKEGYGGDPRASEIASRTVLARSKITRGLKKR
jgi:hypothetical protein